MDIDWASLIKVAVVAFAFAVGIVCMFALGVVGLSRPEGGSRPLGIGLAAISYAACACAVVYGLWLLIPQFH